MKVLATYSIKGGVGKTTSAVNLSYEAARAGGRVLVWDLDPQGAATYFFSVKAKVKGGAERLVSRKGHLGPHIRNTDKPGLDVVPADFSLRHLDLVLDGTKGGVRRIRRLLAGVADSYDVVFLDCPPGITLASESVFEAADVLLVPVIPTTLSARTLVQLADFLADEVSSPLVVPHFTMVERRRSLHIQLMASLSRQWPNVCTSAIPATSTVERMAAERAPVAAFAPRSPAAKAFAALWDEVAVLLWNG